MSFEEKFYAVLREQAVGSSQSKQYRPFPSGRGLFLRLRIPAGKKFINFCIFRLPCYTNLYKKDLPSRKKAARPEPQGGKPRPQRGNPRKGRKARE